MLLTTTPIPTTRTVPMTCRRHLDHPRSWLLKISARAAPGGKIVQVRAMMEDVRAVARDMRKPRPTPNDSRQPTSFPTTIPMVTPSSMLRGWEGAADVMAKIRTQLAPKGPISRGASKSFFLVEDGVVSICDSDISCLDEMYSLKQ